MTNLKTVLQHTKVTFKLVCFLLAAYMTVTQILRYFENNDASYIVFQQFNQWAVDKYPTFTFCLFGKDTIYSDDEEMLFEVNNEVKKLINELEQRDEAKTQ